MKVRNIEKKLYEILGVNIFRKYVLFTLEKLLKPIGGVPGYRIKHLTIYDIEKYKSNAKTFAYAHLWVLISVIALYIFQTIPKDTLIFNFIMNSYCIMTQRYTYIRINEILEKYKEFETKKSERENSAKNEKKLAYDLNCINQPKRVEMNEETLTPVESYYSSKSIETPEHMDFIFDDNFPRLLKK